MYFRQPAIYFLYGYDYRIIGNSSPESYDAFKKTLSATNLVYFLTVFVTFACFSLSVAALIYKVYLKFYLTQIVFVLTLLFIILLGVAAFLMPRPSICC